MSVRNWLVTILVGCITISLGAQQAVPPAGTTASATANGATAPVSGALSGRELPEYRIGPGDVLGILFWRDKELSSDVVVRPDGIITLPVMNEVEVVGLSTEELRELITERSRKYVSEPVVSVVVRQIHSRYVFITGRVNKPGPYQLYGPMTVLQLIAMAAGLQEYADKDSIVIVRDENGKQSRLPFHYDDVVKKGNLSQNITLKPGDTVVVP